MSSLQKALSYVDLIASRRTLYQLGRKPVLSDEETVKLIKSVVRHSPSSFNSQSSRVVILLGEEHERYWRDVVRPTLRKVITDDATFEKSASRLDMFEKAYGTALFYEDLSTIKGLQEKMPNYAPRFADWSYESNGMAQVQTWAALELAGFGANLQHYGNLTQEQLANDYKLSKDWRLHAELVFGSIEQHQLSEKTFIEDEERFRVIGAKA